MRVMIVGVCGLGLMGMAMSLTRQAPRAAPPTAAPVSAPVPNADSVTLQTVKYPQLIDIIHRHRGKVVLVDFWADYCPPCKRNFPHIVALHQQYANRGLVVITVSLDEPHQPGQRDRVLGFLRQQRANCVNLLLDESYSFWQDKLKIDGPPCLFVFDRAGVLRLRVTEDRFDAHAFDQRVAELLR